MPTVTEQEVDAWAHCVQPRCNGSTQVPIKAVRRETGITYRERGGNSPGVESSFVTLHFADEDDAACPHCGGHRDVAAEPRKQYTPLSGHDPMGLLGVPQFNPARQQELAAAPMTDEERQAALEREQKLQGQLVALSARLEALEAGSE